MIHGNIMTSKLPMMMLKSVMGKIVKVLVASSVFLTLIGPAMAAAGYNIQVGNSTGILSKIANSVKEIGDFMTTTMGEVAVLGGFVIAAVLWAFAPKSGAVGYAVRAAIAAIIIFNMTAIISYFTYG